MPQSPHSDPQADLSSSSRPPQRHAPPFLLFFSQSLLWGAALWYLAGRFAGENIWLFGLALLLLALPICFCFVYCATITQIKRLWSYSTGGYYFRLWSGWFLKWTMGISLAFVSGFFLLIQFHTYSPWEWGVFFGVIPIFWIVYGLMARFNATELNPLLVINVSLSWARWLTPLIMLALYFLFLGAMVDPPAYESCLEAVNAQKTAVSDMTGSALVFEASQYLAWYNGVKAYGLGRLGQEGALWSLLVTGLGTFLVFYNGCLILSCFLIPAREYRRLFLPLSDSMPPEPLPPGRIALASGLLLFLICFIYLPLLASLETTIRNHPEVVSLRKEFEKRIVPRVEQIDQELFREGTIAQIQAARLDLLHKLDLSLVRLEGEVDRGFDRMADHVDDYLDWYYSLAGEYRRLQKTLTGNLEKYMAVQLEKTLQQGDAFKRVEQGLNRLLQDHQQIRQEYEKTVGQILERNRIVPPKGTIRVTDTISLANGLALPRHQESIKLKRRLLATSAGGVSSGLMTGLVTKKICAKVLGKNSLKVAAKALGKIVLGRSTGTASGAAAGAAAGAAVGSAVPVVGTAAGAVIGGVVGGIAAGLTVDKMLLLLEEAVNRETFKGEILQALEEARREFKAQLLPRESLADGWSPTPDATAKRDVAGAPQ